MKKIVFLLIVVCALLFSCATDTAAPEDQAAPVVEVTDAPASVATPASVAAPAAVAEPAAAAADVPAPKAAPSEDEPVAELSFFQELAACYVPASEPMYRGIKLIPDNAAFSAISDEARERKDLSEEYGSRNQFLSAWNALGDDDDPYIIALKALHAVQDNCDSIQNQVFRFANADPSLTYDEALAAGGEQGPVIYWDPVSVIENYVNTNCNGVTPPVLDMALGFYYAYSARMLEDEWIMDPDLAFELAVEYYSRAVGQGVYNDHVLMDFMIALFQRGYMDDALQVAHLLEMNETVPEIREFGYHMDSIICMNTGDYVQAAAAAARAWLTSFQEYRSISVMADAFMYKNRDVQSALRVFEESRNHVSDEMYYGSLVFTKMSILWYAEMYDAVIAELSDCFRFEPYDSEYLWNLTDVFYQFQNPTLGVAWIDTLLPEWEDDDLVYGNLLFEQGQLLFQLQQYEEALSKFTECENRHRAAGVLGNNTNLTYLMSQCREMLKTNQKRGKI